MSLFANVVADEINAGAPGLADAWLAAWSINDGAERVRSLEAIAAIPDNAPPTIQAIWAQMNQLVESRGGDPGLAIASVAIVSR